VAQALLKISDGLCIGLHAMVYLAKVYPQAKTIKELAEKVSASPAHLAKVFQQLQKAELVKATRGPKGGYALSKSPKEVTLLEVFEVLQHPIKEHFCLYPEPVCKGNKCILGDMIVEVTRLVKTYLAKTTLEEVKEVF